MNASARFSPSSRSPFVSLYFILQAAGLVALFFLSPAPASAQSVWIDRDLRPAVWAEGFIGPMTGRRSDTFHSTAWYFGSRVPVGERAFLVAELPLAVAGDWTSRTVFPSGETRETVDEGGMAMGNPYLGMEVGSPADGTHFELGLRLPLASEDEPSARFLASTLDWVDRPLAWLPSTGVPLIGKVDYSAHYSSGWFVRLRGGPSAWIRSSGDDTVTFLAHFTPQGGWETERLRVSAGLPMSRIFESGESLARELGMALTVRRWSLEPTLQLRVPLEPSRGRGVVIGLGLVLPS